MEKIIDPISVDILKKELTADKKLVNTNKGHNELYVVTWQDSPNVVTEIGRLREEAFREAGGSTGNAIDLDEYDKMEVPYRQLIVWDPDAEAIIGGYRFLLGADASFDENGQPVLASSHQFHFSQKFIEQYLPHVMELGRSFVAPDYQASKTGSKSIFAMDNLWDGLVALIVKNPDVLYFFGKITLYPDYDYVSKDLIYHFMWKHFGDKEELVRPCEDQSVLPESDPNLMDLILNQDDLIEDYKLLKKAVRSRGAKVPPNFTAYFSITPKMLMFGTAVNRLMHNIEDSGILIPFDEIYIEKKRRYLGTYLRYRMFLRRNKKQGYTPDLLDPMINNWLSKRNRKVKRMLRP